MTLNVLLYMAIMIFTGMIFGRLVKQIKLPNVTGYLIGGLLIGPSVFNIIPLESIENFTVISEVALGFIAFSIGNEFKISYFKRVGVTPIVIAVFEALFAVVFVIIGLLVAGNTLPFSLVLGSIASATAPAATIMVIKQYKAKGPVTETLLSVVALDDAVALILFGISVAVAQTLTSAGASVVSAIMSPVIEIGGALIVGFLLGLLFTVPLKWFKKDGNRMALMCAFVFLGIGIADTCGFSSLLLCMAMGAALANFSSNVNHIMKLSDYITPPIFILFFVLSGAELNLSVLPAIGVAGVVYVVMRVAGKIFGSYFGALIMRSESAIKKYLGPALIPQAGVAIGLSLVATTVVPEYGANIRAIILCGTLIYELIGPAISKMSLKKAGEIK
ncbi:MAG: cation:proton antiporter [Clostridia bacterium]|nr:cation:proton antiporter [Clostridia bacterium]